MQKRFSYSDAYRALIEKLSLIKLGSSVSITKTKNKSTPSKYVSNSPLGLHESMKAPFILDKKGSL